MSYFGDCYCHLKKENEMSENIGENIRSVRKKNKMTLKTLADKTGFSISFLSQLERNKSSATLESLKKISIALGVNPGYFFQNQMLEQERIESSKLEELQISNQNIHYQSLSNDMEYPIFSPLLVTLKPKQNEGNLFQHPGQEFLYVLKGTLTVVIENKKYDLTSNQSIMFDSNQKHYWYNYTNSEVQFLCVNYDDVE